MCEAKRWVGLIPITTNHVRKHSGMKDVDNIEDMNCIDFERARHDAAIEYLTLELNFKEDDMKINKTKLSNSRKGPLMWIEVGESNVAKIFKRASLVQRGKPQKIIILSKIPKEFWSRHRSIDHNCWQARSSNKLLRTQIRLGTNDLELYTKQKNEFIWLKTPLTEFGEINDVELEYKISTPEGRMTYNKRGASPLTGTEKKIREGSEVSDNSAN